MYNFTTVQELYAAVCAHYGVTGLAALRFVLE